jgi:beta-mannosidase
LPTSFDMTLWLSQILQGMAIKYAVEHWRRGMPRGMGTLYWQLNDCWQVASWSSIDYFGNWKALHYMARDFFAPLLISGLEDGDKGTVEIHITSDLLEATDGVAAWTLTDTNGNTLDQGSTDVHAGSRQDTLIETLDLSQWIESNGTRSLLLWLELTIDGEVVSNNFVNFARPKHLNLVEPEIEVEFGEEGGGKYSVSLTTDAPALWTWLEVEGGASFSNNFVHLRPGVYETIVVEPNEPMDVLEFSDRLAIRSLVDTYR